MRLFIAALLMTLGTQAWAECGNQLWTLVVEQMSVHGRLKGRRLMTSFSVTGNGKE